MGPRERGRLIALLVFGVVPLIIAAIELLTERHAETKPWIPWLITLAIVILVMISIVRLSLRRFGRSDPTEPKSRR